MANQIVVSAGAKVRNLDGVLTGTSGVVSSLPIDVSLGIPQLDVNGKILVSQLPNSVMEYKGTWNISTNTPTLVNGTGNQGDVYLVEGAAVGGTAFNFGAGPITFFNGDQAIYSGSIWQRASGATGTVTSVAITETGDSLNITGSPITTSGTINIGFNGTNLQYVNGAGNLTTFPILTGYVTAVSGTAPVVSSGGTTPAISMAAATSSVDGYLSATDFAIFSAKQSALTFSSPLVNTSGTISIPAATTSVNGYLASADFTTFNNKQNAITLTTTGSSGASTLVGATLNIPNYSSALTGYVPYTGATADVDLGAFKLNAQSLHIKGTGGNGHLGLKHQSASATASANEVSLFADSLGDLSWLNGNLYLSKFITSGNTANRSYTFPNLTGIMAMLEATQTFTATNTFTNATKNNGGIFLQNGSSGSTTGYMNLGGTLNGFRFTNDLGITNSFTLPSATGYTFTFPNATGTIALTSDLTGGTVTSVAALTIGTSGTDLSSSVANSTTTPVITLNVPTASATNRGALSSADWTTFNNKQNALTNPVTGTGTTNYLPKFTGASTIGDSAITDDGTTVTLVSRALSGTSASFSSSVTQLGEQLLVSNAGSPNIQLRKSGVTDWGSMTYTGTLLQLGTYAGGQTLNITTGGNVGIGTATPDIVSYGGKILTINGTSNNSGLEIGVSGTSTLGVVANSTAAYITARTAIPIIFETSATERMRITSNNSSATLGSGGVMKLLGTSGSLGVYTELQFYTYNAPTNQPPVSLGIVKTDNGGYENGEFYIATKATNANTAPVERIRITSGGVLQVANASGTLGTIVGSERLNVNGDVYAYGKYTGTSFFESSDMRIKTLIQDNYQTKGIASITPKLYTKNGKVELGYYAQDFVGILDSAVSKGSDDMLSLSYREVLVAKVYALEQEIKELKAKMN